MAAFILRRLIGIIPVLFLVSVVVFSLQLLLPGDPAVGVGGEFATPEQLALIRERMGLDDPVVVRYFDWLASLLSGDFGESLVDGSPIGGEILGRLAVTAQLAIASILAAIAIGLPVGVVQAAFRDRWPDRALKFVTSLGLSIPNFWLAAVFVLVFAVTFQWFPSFGFENLTRSPLDWLTHLVLPATTLGVLMSSELARQVRAGILRTAEAEYVRTAFAKGLSRFRVLSKHQLKNALAPVLAVFGVTVAHLLAGAVLVETIFGIPGLGAYTITAIGSRDLPVIQAVAMISACVTLLISLIVDVLLAQLNPKVRITG
jgi:peptide/nickel transport system permease protein